ncbi:Hypothetical protein NGAL_HAMBI2605_48890 [Neorhizobium galegae bv. orientalis]|nr:Hypothetical protein NGAL_HAMBI2605_48890 [Neorhizobium galegae bv. orientalis]
MHDEAEDLAKTLAYTVGVIANSDGAEKERIAAAYYEAQELAWSIVPDGSSMRPRIEACLHRFKDYQAAGDIAAAGWMLTALQERIGEGDLADWDKLKIIADKAAQLLVPRPSLH